MSQYEHHVKQLQTSSTDYLISIAKDYPVHADIKVPNNFVRGCKNYIWFDTCEFDGTYEFKFASGSMISLGMCIVLGSYLSAKTRNEILSVKYSDLKDFTRHLPGERQKGVQAVLNRIHQRLKG